MENKAAFLLSPKSSLEIQPAPITQPAKNEILIRNHALAMNPLDWKQQDYGALIKSYPHILGVDIAGTIVEVGSEITIFKKGDRVAALAPGTIDGNPESAAFQLYTVAPETVVARIPDDMPFPNAVVLPLALTTASWALFEPVFLGIDAPSTSSLAPAEYRKKVLLVWGGSSSVGSCAIQLASAAGLSIFATASSENFDYVKELGASQVFDYNDPEVVTNMIEAAQGKKVVGAYDPIASDATTMACAKFLEAFGGGKILTTLPDSSGLVLPEGVERLSGPPPRYAEDGGPTVWQIVWADFMRNGLGNGKLRAKPEPLVLGSGLEKLQEGINMCRKGVSARKIVVELNG